MNEVYFLYQSVMLMVRWILCKIKFVAHRPIYFTLS